MEKLGIEPTLLAAQVINFLVILVVLNKLLYKPILGMLERRRKQIADTVSLTEKLKKDDENLKVSREKALARAREDALHIIEEAKKTAKEVEKELVADAHKQAQSIIVRAKAEAVTVEKSAQSALREQAVDLAVVMAKRLLSSVMSEKDQHALIAKRIKDLQVLVPKEKL